MRIDCMWSSRGSPARFCDRRIFLSCRHQQKVDFTFMIKTRGLRSICIKGDTSFDLSSERHFQHSTNYFPFYTRCTSHVCAELRKNASVCASACVSVCVSGHSWICQRENPKSEHSRITVWFEVQAWVYGTLNGFTKPINYDATSIDLYLDRYFGPRGRLGYCGEKYMGRPKIN